MSESDKFITYINSSFDKVTSRNFSNTSDVIDFMLLYANLQYHEELHWRKNCSIR